MLNIQHKKCLVIGGGKVAYRKIKSLLKCGGEVTVISGELCDEIEQLCSENRICVIRRNYISGDAICGYFLVVCAANDPETNRLAAKEAQAQHILVNVADNPQLSSYIVPSVLRRQDLTVAVATGGKSPLLAKRIRHKLEDIISDEYEELLERLARAREKAKQSNLPTKEKLKLYDSIINESGLF